MKELQQKLDRLMDMLRMMDSVVVGFSGGVDSSFLVAAAQRTLGNKAIAITAYSATLPEQEAREAESFARLIGIQHKLIPIDELESPDFVKNYSDRCYYCKQKRFS
ncbi:MAG: asparagine synthase-related protein, partial [Sporomusa sp.]